MRRFLAHAARTVADYWAFRTILVGGFATAVDLTLLILLVQVARFDPVPAAICGVAIGASINFFVNRRFSFHDRGDIGPELVRFALTTGAAMGVHAGIVYLLADRWHVFYVLAKLAADVLVFLFGNLALLRLVVFPARRP